MGWIRLNAEKIWIKDIRVVTLHHQRTVLPRVEQCLTDEKTTILNDFYSVFFDIMIQQKVRQVGLSETGAAMYFVRGKCNNSCSQ